MSPLIRGATIAALLAFGSCAASADVLTFDDLSGTQYFGAVYDGFSFGDLDPSTNDWYFSDVVSSPYTAHSGVTSLSTDASLYGGLPFEDSSGITSATPFVFEGAWFAGYALNADGSATAVQYKLYDHGALVFTSALSATLSDVSAYYASGYAGAIDEVVISGPQGYYAMDDFTYDALAVPEPSVLELGGVGLLALIGLGRRRKAQAVAA